MDGGGGRVIYMPSGGNHGLPFMTSWREGSDLNKTTQSFAIDCLVYVGKFDAVKWETHLAKYQHLRDRCLFVVAPDVIQDADATQAQYARYRAIIHGYGYRVAFVAQDGQTVEALPADYDCLFIGGSTAFKYSAGCQSLVKAAKAQGKWIHMGRVNSRARMGYCKWLGCDSADGTHVSFAPKKRLHEVHGWLAQKTLWEE